jgi:hypothetical protein
MSGQVVLTSAGGRDDAPEKIATEATMLSVVSALSSGLPIASGLPAYGTDATGQDAYAKILDAPARECHYCHVSVGTYGAILSFDGGTTDHLAIPASAERLFAGLVIVSGADVMAKNLVPGSNYTSLNISVW